jgi:hypothetical protein
MIIAEKRKSQLRINYVADIIIGNASKKKIDIGTFWSNRCFRCTNCEYSKSQDQIFCGCTEGLEILTLKEKKNTILNAPNILYIQNECKDFQPSPEECLWRIHSPWANRFPRKYQMDLYL